MCQREREEKREGRRREKEREDPPGTVPVTLRQEEHSDCTPPPQDSSGY